MKKFVILFCIILLFIILGGIFLMTNIKNDNSISENLNTSNLHLTNNNNEDGNIEKKQEKSIEKVKMSIKEGTLTPSSATIVIIDDNDTPYVYSKWFRIDQKTNGQWKEVRTSNDDYNFTAIAYNVDKTGKLEDVVDWGDLYGVLEKGEYRLVKNVYGNDGNEIYFSTDFLIDN